MLIQQHRVLRSDPRLQIEHGFLIARIPNGPNQLLQRVESLAGGL